MPELSTPRLVLRDFGPDDEAAFLDYHADPRFARFYGPEEASVVHARTLVKRFAEWARQQPRRNFQLAVVRRHPPLELVGCCGIREEGCEAREAELGIELAPRWWGHHRVAIEAVEALLQFGFLERRLEVVGAVTVDANRAASRLARYFGFVAVGAPPAPEWMRARGWSNVSWRLTRDRWSTCGARRGFM